MREKRYALSTVCFWCYFLLKLEAIYPQHQNDIQEYYEAEKI